MTLALQPRVMPEEYDKLVRDRIPATIREDGERPVTSRVEGEAYERRLAEKLAEETAEYRESGRVEELADVLEVVHALRAYHGVSEVEQTRERKATERGRFAEGIVLERVEEP